MTISTNNKTSETPHTTLSKEEIAGMETIRYEGRIAVIDTAAEAEKAVCCLNECSLLGFDTETRPSFQKGRSHNVALLQISTPDICFLFRLNRIGFPESLLHLLLNESITKVGLSLRDDFSMLRKVAPFEPGGFVDLQDYVKRFGIGEQSLQKIFALLFGRKISKSQRLSNWEADVLTEAQQRYAATDAWACTEIYRELSKRRPLQPEAPKKRRTVARK